MRVAGDANGNTLSDAQGRGFTWDFENRLVQATNPGVGTTTFRYDPFGRRIQKSGPLGTTNYLYDGMGAWSNVIEEFDQSGNVSARYTQGTRLDQPLAELRGSTTSYYEQDGLNSVSSLSNPAAATANVYSYDAFGRSTASAGTLVNPFQYAGREFDTETSLYFYRARYYDPVAGRFVNEDPLRIRGGINFYAYVTNNPVNSTDPTGLCDRCAGSPPPIPNPISSAFAAFWACANNVTVECPLPSPPSGNPFNPPGGPNGDMGVTPNEGTVPLPQWKIPDACDCFRKYPLAGLDPRFRNSLIGSKPAACLAPLF